MEIKEFASNKVIYFLVDSLLHVSEWKIPWTEEPRGLQSMGSLRVRHD